jgi:hypothetical protein
MNLVQRIEADKFEFKYPPIFRFDLPGGYYPALLQLRGVGSGPPITEHEQEGGPHNLELPGRTLYLGLEIVPEVGSSLAAKFKLRTRWDCTFTWPREGERRALLAYFGETTFGGVRALRLLKLASPELVAVNL